MSATKSQVLAIAATYESQLAEIRSMLATDYDTPAQRIINRGLEAIGVRRFQGGDDIWEMLEALRNDEPYVKPPRHLLERWSAY